LNGRVLLHGALAPPRVALDELVDIVRASTPDPAPDPGPDPKRGLLRRRPAPVVPHDVPPVLEPVAVEQLRLPITGFGNLTATDSRRMFDALTRAAAGWDRPTVHFGGGGALEFPGDRAVWARVEGDVEALMTIARGVTSAVEKLGLFVDRRVFRPMLAVATVTTSTTGPDLEAVVGALEAFRGQDWVVDAVLITSDPSGDGSALQEIERIPIGQD
jgi:2'-5' RNA ligase